MTASDITIRRPIEDIEDVDFLAWLMGVPADRWEHFKVCLGIRLDYEWRHATKPPTAPAKANRAPASVDADIAKICRAFIRALEKRHAPLDRQDQVTKVVGHVLQQVKAPPLGAPKKRASRFETFLENLLYDICALGGRPSFNRRTGKGNVIELLYELRPHLPSRFTPGWKYPPTRSTIERLCAKVRHDPAVEALADILVGEWSPKHQVRWAPPGCPVDRPVATFHVVGLVSIPPADRPASPLKLSSMTGWKAWPTASVLPQ